MLSYYGRSHGRYNVNVLVLWWWRNRDGGGGGGGESARAEGGEAQRRRRRRMIECDKVAIRERGDASGRRSWRIRPSEVIFENSVKTFPRQGARLMTIVPRYFFIPPYLREPLQPIQRTNESQRPPTAGLQTGFADRTPSSTYLG